MRFMKKSTILFLETSPEISAKSAHTISVEEKKEELKKRGFNIITIRRNENLSFKKIKKHNEMQYYLPSINLRFINIPFLIIFLSVFLFFLKENFRIIYCHNEYNAIPLYIYKKLNNKGTKLIHYDVLGLGFIRVRLSQSKTVSDKFREKVSFIQNKVLFNTVDMITTINNVYKLIIEKYTRKPVFVLRTAINEEIFRKKIDIKDANNFLNENKVILYLGRVYEKRLEEIYYAVIELLKDREDFIFVIIGFGDDYNYYKKKTQRIGLLNKKIYFLGLQPHNMIPYYLSKSDICYADSFLKTISPKKTYEYLAMGCATIAKDSEPNREVFKENVHIIYYGTTKELKEKLNILLDDEKLRKQLGKKGREYVLNYHTWEKRVDELLNIYKDMV